MAAQLYADMPTILSHAAVPLALNLALGRRLMPTRLLVAAMVAAILPDLDVIAFKLGIAYAHALGHRGVSHSALFALVLGLVALLGARHLQSNRLTAFTIVGLSALSHGLLDMLTTGGMGVALWWPWSEQRVFAPWQMIRVSPIGLHAMLSERGLVVLLSELRWVWLPALTLGLCALSLRRTLSRKQPLGPPSISP